ASRWSPRSLRGNFVTRPPIAASRDANSAPHRSTAALSVVGDSSRTSVSTVSISHPCSARQKFWRSIIKDMYQSRTSGDGRLGQRQISHTGVKTQRKSRLLRASGPAALIILFALFSTFFAGGIVAAT